MRYFLVALTALMSLNSEHSFALDNDSPVSEQCQYLQDQVDALNEKIKELPDDVDPVITKAKAIEDLYEAEVLLDKCIEAYPIPDPTPDPYSTPEPTGTPDPYSTPTPTPTPTASASAAPASRNPSSIGAPVPVVASIPVSPSGVGGSSGSGSPSGVSGSSGSANPSVSISLPVSDTNIPLPSTASPLTFSTQAMLSFGASKIFGNPPEDFKSDSARLNSISFVPGSTQTFNPDRCRYRVVGPLSDVVDNQDNSTTQLTLPGQVSYFDIQSYTVLPTGWEMRLTSLSGAYVTLIYNSAGPSLSARVEPPAGYLAKASTQAGRIRVYGDVALQRSCI